MIQDSFLEDLLYWVETDRRVAAKVLSLMREVRRDPFRGTGKPELLRHHLRGCWSRRIDREHRFVYRVRGDRVELLSARYHYR